MTLRNAEEGKEYIVKSISVEDEELESFLFSLGCYGGEAITVITQLPSGCIVAIKNGRYTVDKLLASSITVA